MPVPVAEPAPVPILVELDPLVQAPPIASEPTYLSLFGAIGRHSLAQYARKPARRGVTAARARFVEYQALLVDVSPEEAALRWAALQQPQARPRLRQGLAGDARLISSAGRRPAPYAPGQQALLFGVGLSSTPDKQRAISLPSWGRSRTAARSFSFPPGPPMSQPPRAAFARIEALRIARKPEKRRHERAVLYQTRAAPG